MSAAVVTSSSTQPSEENDDRKPAAKPTSHRESKNGVHAPELFQAQLPGSDAGAEDRMNSPGTGVVAGVNSSSLESHSAGHGQVNPLLPREPVRSVSETVNLVKSSDALPKELHRLLSEVARTGTSSSLNWHDQTSQLGVSKGSSAPSSGRSTPASQRHHRPHHYEHGTNSKNKRARLDGRSRRNQQSRASVQRHFHGSSTTTTTTTTTTTATRSVLRNGLQRHGSNSRKRPLYLRTSGSSGIFSPGSVGSGRTSGSEPEESSHYECDSEGTSATSNSEISFDQGRASTSLQKRLDLGLGKLHSASDYGQTRKHTCLKDVFRCAMELVLDHFYKNRGGYKLSPAERKVAVMGSEKSASSNRERHKAETEQGDGMASSGASTGKDNLVATLNGEATQEGSQDDLRKQATVFKQRKRKLLSMLGQHSDAIPTRILPIKSPRWMTERLHTGPPFTIQRIAEVLVSPDRYYTQTQKLCNCLEKLLLVTSSATDFGGSTGGDTRQNRRETTELAALADEKGRLSSELQQSRRRTRQKIEVSLAGDTGGEGNDQGCGRANKAIHATHKGAADTEHNLERVKETDGDEDHNGQSVSAEETSRELEAAARASLRTKFDHVGIAPHSSAAVNGRDARSMVENRGMTNSPPPPSLGIAAAPAISLPVGHSGLLRHSHGSPTSPDKEHPSLARTSSPILAFSSGEGSPPIPPIHPTPSNMHLLHLHHPASMQGVSPFELMGLNSSASGGTVGAITLQSLAGREMELECRSSASSDVDSESDVSFDDSASDRSDGSDSGHHEPLTAARAMALNRMHQQQRLQSRVFTALQHHGTDGFRPPADSEYQSGDSIDSTRAEDSGGSDSSSSDLAD